MNDIYRRVYFHAVRRAMLENETILREYMDNVAIHYDDEKLEKLDRLLVSIHDNDLFDVIMGHTPPEHYKNKYDLAILTEILHSAEQRNINNTM